VRYRGGDPAPAVLLLMGPLPKIFVLFGFDALMWLKALNASNRKMVAIFSVIANDFVIDQSVLKNCGP
jgi:hypothetical protein